MNTQYEKIISLIQELIPLANEREISLENKEEDLIVWLNKWLGDELMVYVERDQIANNDFEEFIIQLRPIVNAGLRDDLSQLLEHWYESIEEEESTEIKPPLNILDIQHQSPEQMLEMMMQNISQQIDNEYDETEDLMLRANALLEQNQLQLIELCYAEDGVLYGDSLHVLCVKSEPKKIQKLKQLIDCDDYELLIYV